MSDDVRMGRGEVCSFQVRFLRYKKIVYFHVHLLQMYAFVMNLLHIFKVEPIFNFIDCHYLLDISIISIIPKPKLAVTCTNIF